jgi:Uma2 family endonuclease
MKAIARETFSLEYYLKQEEQADFKSEYLDGKVIPMTGGTTNHNQIAVNITTELNIALKNLDYRVYMGDVRLWMPERQIFTYPDIMVIKGSPIYYENHKDTIVNPTLIIEVLSPSTQSYDREGKFIAYRSIKSFQEYVLISQTQIYGEKFVKTGEKKWSLQEYYLEDNFITLELGAVSLKFTDVYHKVDLNDQNGLQ